jgi:hypothetical protein
MEVRQLTPRPINLVAQAFQQVQIKKVDKEFL